MSESLTEYVKNEYFMGTIFLFTVLYAIKCQNVLPSTIESFFKNDLFKIIYLSLLLIVAFKTLPHVAITVSIVFVLVGKTLQN